MPIEHKIDHARQLVQAKGLGILTDMDVFGYQQEVWSRPDVAGYDELMDMTEVEKIALPSTARVRHLASLSASMDSETSVSKFAIVAPDDLAFGLGRMYEAHRALDARSTKVVRVFRSRPEAMTWLGIDN